MDLSSISHPLKIVSTDARRTIYEHSSRDGNYVINYFDIHATVPLGNHYHTEKDEHFIILEGSGVYVSAAHTTEASRVLSQRHVVPLRTLDTVFVPVFTAHAFILTPGSKMTCFGNAPWNNERPDIHPLKIVSAEEAQELLKLTA
jgi:mannose-6-phosphate isomerase-like protein (cupin superfamily)